MEELLALADRETEQALAGDAWTRGHRNTRERVLAQLQEIVDGGVDEQRALRALLVRWTATLRSWRTYWRALTGALRVRGQGFKLAEPTIVLLQKLRRDYPYVPKERLPPLTREACLGLGRRMTPWGKAALFLAYLTGLRGPSIIDLRQGDLCHMLMGSPGDNPFLALLARAEKKRPHALPKWSVILDREMEQEVVSVIGVDHAPDRHTPWHLRPRLFRVADLDGGRRRIFDELYRHHVLNALRYRVATVVACGADGALSALACGHSAAQNPAYQDAPPSEAHAVARLVQEADGLGVAVPRRLYPVRGAAAMAMRQSPLCAEPMEQPLAAVQVEPMPEDPVSVEPPLQPDPMAMAMRGGPVVANPPPRGVVPPRTTGGRLVVRLTGPVRAGTIDAFFAAHRCNPPPQ